MGIGIFWPTLLEMFRQGGKRVILHGGLDLFIQQITNDDSARSHGYDTSKVVLVAPGGRIKGCIGTCYVVVALVGGTKWWQESSCDR